MVTLLYLIHKKQRVPKSILCFRMMEKGVVGAQSKPCLWIVLRGSLLRASIFQASGYGHMVTAVTVTGTCFFAWLFGCSLYLLHDAQEIATPDLLDVGLGITA